MKKRNKKSNEFDWKFDLAFIIMQIAALVAIIIFVFPFMYNIKSEYWYFGMVGVTIWFIIMVIYTFKCIINFINKESST